MNFHVLTLFPEMIENASAFGVVGQARKQGLISVSAVSPRAFTHNVHQTVDDRPFGGGDGMIMLAEPLSQALEQIRTQIGLPRPRVIHLSPRGKVLSDALVREFATQKNLVLIASRYGGVDQRFLNQEVDEEISIGDYVLSGGELGALVLIDAVSRHVPGVLGNEASPLNESFSGDIGLLECPQFTRPREWKQLEVPPALLSGNHAQIAVYQDALSILVTLERRPELLLNAPERVHTLGKKRLGQARKLLERFMADAAGGLEAAQCGLQDLPSVFDRLREIEAVTLEQKR